MPTLEPFLRDEKLREAVEGLADDFNINTIIVNEVEQDSTRPTMTVHCEDTLNPLAVIRMILDGAINYKHQTFGRDSKFKIILIDDETNEEIIHG